MVAACNHHISWWWPAPAGVHRYVHARGPEDSRVPSREPRGRTAKPFCSLLLDLRRSRAPLLHPAAVLTYWLSRLGRAIETTEHLRPPYVERSPDDDVQPDFSIDPSAMGIWTEYYLVESDFAVRATVQRATVADLANRPNELYSPKHSSRKRRRIMIDLCVMKLRRCDKIGEKSKDFIHIKFIIHN